MNATTKTPGYNSRIQIAFSVDKHGKRLAHYVGGGLCGRLIRMSLVEAEQLVAQGQADQVERVSVAKALKMY
jgi:hypothetical protein